MRPFITCFAKCFVCVHMCRLYLCVCPRVALRNVLRVCMCRLYLYICPSVAFFTILKLVKKKRLLKTYNSIMVSFLCLVYY